MLRSFEKNGYPTLVPTQVLWGSGRFFTFHPDSSQRGQFCVYEERGQRASPGSHLLGSLSGAARRAQGVVLEVGPNLEKVTVECLKVKPHTGPLPVVPAVLAKWGRPRKEKKGLFIILFLLFILVEASSWGGPCRGQ